MGEKKYTVKNVRREREILFLYYIRISMLRVFTHVKLKKIKKKKKEREKRNGRKKNKKKNSAHSTPIGKNDAPRFILFRYVDSRITL